MSIYLFPNFSSPGTGASTDGVDSLRAPTLLVAIVASFLALMVWVWQQQPTTTKTTNSVASDTQKELKPKTQLGVTSWKIPFVVKCQCYKKKRYSSRLTSSSSSWCARVFAFVRFFARVLLPLLLPLLRVAWVCVTAACVRAYDHARVKCIFHW